MPPLLALALLASGFTVYIGEIEPRAVVIAWGNNVGSGNRIGQDAHTWGSAVVHVGPRSVSTSKAWVRIDGLQPDTEYEYSLDLDGKRAATGRVRTWPEKASDVAFLVIGDYGNGTTAQYAVARAMTALVNERARTANPVRFILTVGDNIYGIPLGLIALQTGKDDSDWWPRFFDPYRDILASLPFYPTLGNHDGNESEAHGDLPVYLDNFFFPGGTPSRWYHFNYAGLVDFFALDSTSNTLRGPPKPAFADGGEQSKWLNAELPRATAPWKIPYFHHSIFNAGPGHYGENNEERYRHWLDLFARNGVKAAFQGHEHNFQASFVNSRSRGIRHFVTGAGGQLRDRDVRARMQDANIEAWAAQHEFLLVEIHGDVMTVTPLGAEPIRPVKADGTQAPVPFTVRLQ